MFGAVFIHAAPARIGLAVNRSPYVAGAGVVRQLPYTADAAWHQNALPTVGIKVYTRTMRLPVHYDVEQASCVGCMWL